MFYIEKPYAKFKHLPIRVAVFHIMTEFCDRMWQNVLETFLYLHLECKMIKQKGGGGGNLTRVLRCVKLACLDVDFVLSFPPLKPWVVGLC